MGIELILGAASLAIGAISTVSSINTANQASNAMAKSANAQKTANNISIAKQSIANTYDIRQRIRENRVRDAQLQQGAMNVGASDSSGVAGATSALAANFGGLVGESSSESKANSGINYWNQRAADFENSARTSMAWGDVWSKAAETGQQSIKTFQNIFNL